MAQSCWQHEITRLNVVAFAVGGSEARERVPGGEPPAMDDTASTSWADAHGRWNLGKLDSQGNVIPTAPKLSPEEDQRRKEIAVGKLLGIGRRVAKQGGKAPPLDARAKAVRAARAGSGGSTPAEGGGAAPAASGGSGDAFSAQLSRANARADKAGD